MAALFRSTVDQICDSSNLPLPGARIFFYTAGTTTPKDVYSNSGLTSVQTQPVLCDSAGRVPVIFMQAALYKVRIEDATDPANAPAGTGTLVREVDNYDPGLGVGAGALPISAGGTGATTAAVARDNLGVPSQSDIDDLAATVSSLRSGGVDALVGLSKADGQFVVGDGTTFVGENPTNARTSLGLGALATLAFTDLVYTGSAAGNTTFPIGSVVAAAVLSAPDRNASSTVRLSTTDTFQFTTAGAGTALTGTWRARGAVSTTDNIHLFQRVA